MPIPQFDGWITPKGESYHQIKLKIDFHSKIKKIVIIFQSESIKISFSSLPTSHTQTGHPATVSAMVALPSPLPAQIPATWHAVGCHGYQDRCRTSTRTVPCDCKMSLAHACECRTPSIRCNFPIRNRSYRWD